MLSMYIIKKEEHLINFQIGENTYSAIDNQINNQFKLISRSVYLKKQSTANCGAKWKKKTIQEEVAIWRQTTSLDKGKN